MRGRITDWKDERGFGFIEPESGGRRVFFHISNMVRGAPRPSIGDVVSYEMAITGDGRSSAVEVRPTGLNAVSGMLLSKRVFLSVVATLVFPVLWWYMKIGMFPAILFWAFAGMSSVTFILYGLDKSAAKREVQRTPESRLQFCALLGGWPGALLAQQLFRHKSSKLSFQLIFWFTVMLNCGVLWLVVSPTGAAFIRQFLQAWSPGLFMHST